MISRKELDYVNLWANKVPYPGREYCEETIDKLEECVKLFDEDYANRIYNIIFSDQEEIQLEIKQKNICHMLGIDHSNLVGDYFSNYRKDILDYDPTSILKSYDLVKLIIENKDKVLDFDEANRNRAINYYKVSIKSDIFKKLADLSNFNYGCIKFDKTRFYEATGGERIFNPNSTRFLYTESDESVSPYFFMGLKKEFDTKDNTFVQEDDYYTREDNRYIVETLMAAENYQDFFNGQEVVIPTQILKDLNGRLNKKEATPKDKLKLLKEYQAIINHYGYEDKMNIYGDYLTYLMQEQRERTPKMLSFK